MIGSNDFAGRAALNKPVLITYYSINYRITQKVTISTQQFT